MSFVRLSAAALVAMATAACSGNPETGTGPRENTGTLVGAVVKTVAAGRVVFAA